MQFTVVIISFCLIEYVARSVISYSTLSFNKVIPKISISIACLILLSCRGSQPEIALVSVSARLVKVVSPQTIEVLINNLDERSYRVRIIGIDPPKPNNNILSDRAKQRLTELIDRDCLRLELESDELDRYNRLLAHVWCEDVLIGEELVKAGYAIANTK